MRSTLEETSVPVLEVRNLYTRIGATPVHRDVTMELWAGEAVTVVGSNGAGKTTLLRTIMGFVNPMAGSVSIRGIEVNGLPIHERAKHGLAYVPEGRRIFAELTVKENLFVGGHSRQWSRGREREKLDELFEVFPVLGGRASQLGGQLSGGQQQMLAIGRALMADPQVLLLDEPSLGLAPPLVADLAGVLGRIRSTLGTAVLLVEQNASLAFAVCERAYLMIGGEVVSQGLVSEFLESEAVKELYLGAVGGQAHRPLSDLDGNQSSG